MTDPLTGLSYENVFVFVLIAAGLRVTLGTTVHNANNKYYVISASSTNSRHVIANYFCLFPLFSSKRLNYLD